MHPLRRPRPARLRSAALAATLSLLLSATAASGTASADGTGLGSMKPGGEPVTGSQPFVNILCKVPDEPDEPLPAAGMRTIFGIDGQGSTANSAYPTVDRHWREVSYNTVNPHGGAREVEVCWPALRR